MKVFSRIFSTICLTAFMSGISFGAIEIKKAPIVAENKDKGTVADTGKNLAPTLINLVMGVRDVMDQSNALKAGCDATTQDAEFVNKVMQEWAKSGALSSDEVWAKLATDLKNVQPAIGTSGNEYATSIKNGAGVPDAPIFYDKFNQKSDIGTIWENYPKAGIVKFCKEGGNDCRNQSTASNVYDLFALITFGVSDYLPGEASHAAKLITKIEDCSRVKLSTRQKAIWMGFLTNTMGTIGQNQGTGDIMQMVGGLSQQGGGAGGALQGLGGIATQFLGK